MEERFNIPLLSERLISVTSYITESQKLKKLPIVFFGASNGAASALTAAAKLNGHIHAIVSRSGRPNLAMPALRFVKAPALLIAGSMDAKLLEYNKQAYEQLVGEKRFEIIGGASHLFEESEKLEKVAALTTSWFKKYITKLKIKIHTVTG